MKVLTAVAVLSIALGIGAANARSIDGNVVGQAAASSVDAVSGAKMMKADHKMAKKKKMKKKKMMKKMGM